MEVDQICRTDFQDPEQPQRTSAAKWGIELRRTYGPLGRGIIHPMTRHKHAHTGLVTPQLPQLWLTAVLRMLAMLVLHVASTLQMICRRDPVIGTQAMLSDVPKAKTDTQHKETPPAANPSSPKALNLRDRRHTARTADIPRAIVSKDEGVLTTLSPSFLRKQGERRRRRRDLVQWTKSRSERRRPQEPRAQCLPPLASRSPLRSGGNDEL